MKKRFIINEEAYLNENINNSFKPERHGHKVKIWEVLFNSQYDYRVYDYDKKDIIKVKEDELDPIPEKQYKINNNKDEYKFEKIGNEIEYVPTQEVVTIDKVDYIHKTKDISDLHNEICQRLNDICTRKNKDYKNSFSDTWDEFGVISLVIRLNDKMLRLKQLSKYEAQVKDESLKDTLMDMANYCILGIIELEKNSDK